MGHGFIGYVSEITFSFLGYLLMMGSARGSRTVVTRSYLGSANVCKKSIYFESNVLTTLASVGEPAK